MFEINISNKLCNILRKKCFSNMKTNCTKFLLWKSIEIVNFFPVIWPLRFSGNFFSKIAGSSPNGSNDFKLLIELH